MRNTSSKARISKEILAAALAMLGAVPVMAADNQSVLSSLEAQRERQTRPLWIYGALGAGYGLSQGNEFTHTPDGTAISLGGVLSYRLPQWVFDGGVYWQQVSLSGQLPNGAAVDIKTRSGGVELSPRYRISDQVDIGPAASMLFGTNTNFSAANDASNSAVFAGLRINYELPGETLNTRLTASAQNGISISERNVWLITAGVQFGLPFGHARTVEVAKTEPAPAPVRVVAQAPKPEVRVSLSPKVVYFATGSNKLSPKGQKIIHEIGSFLGKNDVSWGALEISGHTDHRGSYQYNLKLSERRAGAVIEELVRGGARPAKLKAEAFAFARPIATGADQLALAQNRRVELVFKNVSNPGLLEKEIRRIADGRPMPDALDGPKLMEAGKVAKSAPVKAKKQTTKKKAKKASM